MSDISSQIRSYESPLVAGQPTPEAPVDDAMGRDTFLKLLTTQMQNQDPTNPMKNEEFVAQLAQFSSLEQLMGLQSVMEGVYVGVMSMNNASMAALVGSEVVAVGDQVRIDGGEPVELHFDAASSIESGTITITDEDGKVVDTIEVGAQEEGEFSVTWDAKDTDGDVVDDGLYTFRIEGADGEELDVQSMVVGTVTEMDYSSGVPQPSVEGVVVGIDAILKLTAAGESSAEEAPPADDGKKKG
jgi:flagellar basal-body rod modification protein FlgD